LSQIKPDLNLRSGFGILSVLFLLLGLVSVTVTAQTKVQSPVPLPVPFTPIVDNANVIDEPTKLRLGSIYLNLKQRADIEFAVLTVATTGDLDIFDFSLAVARGWGIGAKEGDKKGFLLVVAIQDRKYFTQVSDHLEGDLPDGLVGQIEREQLVPAFKRRNYSKGISDTIESYVATLATKQNFSIAGIDKTRAYASEEKKPGGAGLCGAIILLAFILIVLFSASRRGGGGCLQALFWGTLFSNLGGGSRRWGGSGSGWSGGGFGGSGGSGGFGGGFGGGGSFGGGGAGGSW
jgi:uncharacterized protein